MYFFAPATYFNVRRLVCGFLEFGRIVFQTCPDVSSIPMLFSTTSSLEAVFSLLRGADNRALTLAVTNERMGSVNIKNATKCMDGSYYDKSLVPGEGRDFFDSFLSRKAQPQEVQEKIDFELLQRSDTAMTSDSNLVLDAAERVESVVSLPHIQQQHRGSAVQDDIPGNITVTTTLSSSDCAAW